MSLYTSFFSTIVVLALQLPAAAQTPTISDDDEDIYILNPFTVAGGFGATPGGAQDMEFVRSQIRTGRIPHPNTIRAEGLLSEYDLPLPNQNTCTDLICVNALAMKSSLINQPDAAFLSQIGFSSGLDPKTWKRQPVNLVAVVDKSGSMSGTPLEKVKTALTCIAKQLHEEDQISIVLYGDLSHVHLDPTPCTSSNHGTIIRTIEAIESAGSTNMEEGLKVGYKVALDSSDTFKGNTRLMLFTDEQPNTGDTRPDSFMSLMREGSKKGFGLTTIGVGVNFGAELANKISSVRGGNLFYFEDSSAMIDKFVSEFDVMVTELAYDMKLSIVPSAGFRISGVYGLPGDLLKWGEDGRSIVLSIDTLFLSLNKGAVYCSFAPQNPQDLPEHEPDSDFHLAKVLLSFVEAGDHAQPKLSELDIPIVKRERAPVGLSRGELLVDTYLSLKSAAQSVYFSNDPKAAYSTIRENLNRLRSAADPVLEKEIDALARIEISLARSAGYLGEASTENHTAPVYGVWAAFKSRNPDIKTDYLFYFSGDSLLLVDPVSKSRHSLPSVYSVATAPFPEGSKGSISFLAKKQTKSIMNDDNGMLKMAVGSASLWNHLRSVHYSIEDDIMKMTLRFDRIEDDRMLVLQRLDSGEDSFENTEPDPAESITGLPEKS